MKSLCKVVVGFFGLLGVLVYVSVYFRLPHKISILQFSKWGMQPVASMKVEDKPKDAHIHQSPAKSAVPLTQNTNPVANMDTHQAQHADSMARDTSLNNVAMEESYPLLDVYSDIQQIYLIDYFRFHGMRAKPGLGRRERTRVIDIEKRYLDTPALANVSFCPDELKSKVYLVSQHKVYRVGDTVRIRVDLYDQLGRIRTSGGDEIRMWLKNPYNAVPVRVTDLGNGSYAGETTLRWAGKAKVAVSLTYSREFLRLVLELRQAVLSTRHIIAKYINKEANVMEITPCLPSAPIPGYGSTCNLTVENGMVPWFCGQPTSPGLSCAHPYVHLNLPFLKPLPITGPAKDLDDLMNSKDDLKRLIPNSIEIQTQEGGLSPPPLPPCWSRPRRESWELPWQQGWLEKRQWIPDTCSIPSGLTMEGVQDCLRNTSLLLLGDSNARLMYAAILSVLGRKDRINWHRPNFREMPELNSSIVYAPHARPFNPGSGVTGGIQTLSTEQVFPYLATRRHQIVVLHYWLHFVFYPLSVFRDRIRQAKRSVQRHLLKHPTAKILIRGPHVVYNGQNHHTQVGDKQGAWFIQIMKQEFRDLYDKVWFLDFWPISIASENVDLHLPNDIIIQTLRVLFGYACQTAA